MVKKIVSILTSIHILLNGMVVFAKEDISISVAYKPNTAELAITGTGHGEIVITITPEELLPSDMTVSSMPMVIKQISSSGVFALNIGMPYNAAGGKYIVYATSDEGEATDSFMHIDTTAASSVIEALNDAEDINVFRTLLADNAQILGIDTNDAVYISENNRITKMLYNMTFGDSVDFNRNYYMVYAICSIKIAKKDQIELLLGKYQEQLGIDMEALYYSETRLDDNAKQELLSLFAETDLYSHYTPEELSETLTELKPLAALRCANNWVTFKEIIAKDFAADFKELLEDRNYLNLSEQDRVFELMKKKKTPTTFEDIKEIFLDSVAEAVDEAKDNGGSGSGGGSKGGSKGTVITSSIEKEADNEKEEETIKQLFTDLPVEHWGAKSVSLLTAEGILNGYQDGSFLPSKEISRAEFVKMTMGLYGKILNEEPPKTDTGVLFDDVKSTDWFAECVYSATAAGIVKGDNTSFRPNDKITREDSVVIIYRLLTKKGLLSKKVNFSDADEISYYAKNAVSYLAGEGFVNGFEDGTFSPKSFLTRVQAAQLIYNVLTA